MESLAESVVDGIRRLAVEPRVDMPWWGFGFCLLLSYGLGMGHMLELCREWVRQISPAAFDEFMGK